MGQKLVKGSPELAKRIKLRRHELNLTIEEAAQKAGVGTKTWSRYESGESIRRDKCRGICKALNWLTLPTEASDEDSPFELDDCKNHKAWSRYLAETFGTAAATSFVIGSDILLDHLQEDMQALASMPRGSHIGQISTSFLVALLPSQFLMRYDYDFLYILYTTVTRLQAIAHKVEPILAHSVLEELAFYLIVEESGFLMDGMQLHTESNDGAYEDDWNEWIFDMFDDMDLLTFLYADIYLEKDHAYHFDHWLERQFYC